MRSSLFNFLICHFADSRLLLSGSRRCRVNGGKTGDDDAAFGEFSGGAFFGDLVLTALGALDLTLDITTDPMTDLMNNLVTTILIGPMFDFTTPWLTACPMPLKDRGEDNFGRQHRIESNGLKPVPRVESKKALAAWLGPVGIFIAISWTFPLHYTQTIRDVDDDEEGDAADPLLSICI